MHTVTIQPLTADGLPFDLPELYQHADLFDALNDAHQKLRMARLAGAVIAVEGEGSAFQWLATYEDGEAGRFTVTQHDETPEMFGTCETPQYLDTLTCVCTNNPFHDGFANATREAVEVDQEWDSRHIACRTCGRVYDQTRHQEATGQVPVVAGPQPFTPLPSA